MADPVVWGPIGWRAMFALAKHLDSKIDDVEDVAEKAEMCFHAQTFFSTLSFCFSCDHCSYFAIEYTVQCPVPRCLYLEYLYDMKACVDAKIKTVQYDKYQVEECLPPHLSRLAFYKKMSMDDLDVMDSLSSVQDDWHKFWILSAIHSTGHPRAKVRWRALREAMYRFAILTGKPWTDNPIESLEDVKRVLLSWNANVDRLLAWARPLFS